ncbi:hypothetical protein JH271_18615 [Xanthomonas campestris pv. campestris]|nr:hypothetical protein JH301_02785 [Xanthomonas campestris pv. campestris]WDK62427.1 hypothetical protein JH271_18615 [Xanthomonas campestris pv. campestris]WDK66465.1 hypothetical protein JH258_18640 [Xanthomonas campestris pv. campestris]WDK70343.1 hypothetical protein JH284_17815 [Xanthomonas campestris pv. campestris]WDK74536.1 hypothetical protein JH294_18640 [Xanthomonas campestris pv. campestris]
MTAINRIAGWVLSAVLMLPTVVAAQINNLPSRPHLLMKGQAFLTVDPDWFMIDLRVSKTELQPDLACKFIKELARVVLDGLQRNHVLKDSLYASALSIAPQSRYQDCAAFSAQRWRVTGEI